jgi:hypothetical protein
MSAADTELRRGCGIASARDVEAVAIWVEPHVVDAPPNEGAAARCRTNVTPCCSLPHAEELSMAIKMQAAFVEKFGKPLRIMECDIPSPTPGQILVKTEA